MWQWERGYGDQQKTWFNLASTPYLPCGLGKRFDLSEPLLPHLENGGHAVILLEGDSEQGV